VVDKVERGERGGGMEGRGKVVVLDSGQVRRGGARRAAGVPPRLGGTSVPSVPIAAEVTRRPGPST
jgi:hypothetical protein